MWPVAASTSYLFREPDGISTKTITSAMRETYPARLSVTGSCDREACRRRRRPSGVCPAAGGDPAAEFGSCRIPLGELEPRNALDEQVEEGVRVEVDADVRVRRRSVRCQRSTTVRPRQSSDS